MSFTLSTQVLCIVKQVFCCQCSVASCFHKVIPRHGSHSAPQLFQFHGLVTLLNFKVNFEKFPRHKAVLNSMIIVNLHTLWFCWILLLLFWSIGYRLWRRKKVGTMEDLLYTWALSHRKLNTYYKNLLDLGMVFVQVWLPESGAHWQGENTQSCMSNSFLFFKLQ